MRPGSKSRLRPGTPHYGNVPQRNAIAREQVGRQTGKDPNTGGGIDRLAGSPACDDVAIQPLSS